MGDGKALTQGSRAIQQWNQWLSHALGQRLLSAEQQCLTELLQQQFGKHAVLLGVPQQSSLLDATLLPCQTLLFPSMEMHQPAHHTWIEGDFHELALLTGSMDLVLIPHTLEFVDNARQLLAEACRVVRPEGLIAICGFNPYSAWGIKKLWEGKHARMPWRGNFIDAYQITHWLTLADFVLEQHRAIFFRPPLQHTQWYERLSFLESLGKYFPFFGGVYVLIARAKVIPLTPIRMQWRQELSGLRIPRTMTGTIIVR